MAKKVKAQAKAAKANRQKQKPLKKRPNDLLIAVYQTIGQHICAIKKRHWALLFVLGASHVFFLANGQQMVRESVVWNLDLLWAHVGIALLLGVMMWHGSYSLRDARVQQKRAHADLIGRDPGLGSVLMPNTQDESRGDILLHLSAIYAPLFSIAIILKQVDPGWMLKIVCLAAVLQLLDIILQKSPKMKPPTFFAISIAVFVVELWYIFLLT